MARLLTPEQCCVQIVDPQASLMKHIHEAARVERAIGQIIECAHVLGLPLFGNTQYREKLGPYVGAIAEKMAAATCFDKMSFNALAGHETAGYIRRLPSSVNTIILAGVETHICIYQTAMAILDEGLTPWIVADGVSSRSPVNHDLGLQRLAREGCLVGPAEMIIYELLAKAGTTEFKAMLPHII